jgi:probable rRNA maturation factor
MRRTGRRRARNRTTTDDDDPNRRTPRPDGCAVSIEISNESGAVVDEAALVRLGRFVLDALGIDQLAELSVLLVDVDTMAALHVQWMDMPGPTDVLAFPMDGAELPTDRADPSAPLSTDHGAAVMLGDVVLCPAVAADQASSAGHSVQAELHLLCTHAILHLLGYDHSDAEQEHEMFQLQAKLVGDWSRHAGIGPIRAPLPGTGGEVRDSAGGRR